MINGVGAAELVASAVPGDGRRWRSGLDL